MNLLSQIIRFVFYTFFCDANNAICSYSRRCDWIFDKNRFWFEINMINWIWWDTIWRQSIHPKHAIMNIHFISFQTRMKCSVFINVYFFWFNVLQHHGLHTKGIYAQGFTINMFFIDWSNYASLESHKDASNTSLMFNLNSFINALECCQCTMTEHCVHEKRQLLFLIW